MRVRLLVWYTIPAFLLWLVRTLSWPAISARHLISVSGLLYSFAGMARYDILLTSNMKSHSRHSARWAIVVQHICRPRTPHLAPPRTGSSHHQRHLLPFQHPQQEEGANRHPYRLRVIAPCRTRERAKVANGMARPFAARDYCPPA